MNKALCKYVFEKTADLSASVNQNVIRNNKKIMFKDWSYMDICHFISSFLSFMKSGELNKHLNDYWLTRNHLEIGD